jgi:hypothetical protein
VDRRRVLGAKPLDLVEEAVWPAAVDVGVRVAVVQVSEPRLQGESLAFIPGCESHSVVVTREAIEEGHSAS